MNLYYSASAQIAADKKLHYFMAYWITDISTNIWNIDVGLTIGIVLVILKEVMDKLSKEHGQSEMADFIYGMLGIATRWGMYYVFD